MDQATRKCLEKLSRFVMEVDCRLMALQKYIENSSQFDAEQKEQFRSKLKEDFDFFVQLRLEQAENHDQGLAGRLLGDWNPNAIDQSKEEGK